MPETKNILKKIAAVMSMTTEVAKGGYNTAQGYKFAQDVDVINAVREHLVANNVVVLPEVTSVRETPITTGKGTPMTLTTVSLNMRLVDADSGEEVVTSMAGQGTDTGDKGIYKAITGAVKYFILKTFLIPTMDDAERQRDDEVVAVQVMDEYIEPIAMPQAQLEVPFEAGEQLSSPETICRKCGNPHCTKAVSKSEKNMGREYWRCPGCPTNGGKPNFSHWTIQ